MKTRNYLIISTLIVPTLLLITGPLFLYTYRRDLFVFGAPAGIYLTIVIALIIGILGFLTWFLIKKIGIKVWKRVILSFLHGLVSVIAILFIIVSIFTANFYFSSNHYSTGPMLSWGSDQNPKTETTVMWRTKQPTDSIVYLGTAPSNLYLQFNSEIIDEWHMVPVWGLDPDTTYYYRVEGLKAEEIFHFTTAPETDKDFEFLLFSDARQNSGVLGTFIKPNVPKFMMKTMESEGTTPAFTIVCGDITGEGDNEATWKSWMDDVSKKSGLASYAPLQVAVGNHERMVECTGALFDKYYPYEAQPQYYYSFNYSSVHIQVLDPFNYGTCWWGNFTAEQLAWAEADLQASSSMKYKIVALHPPPVDEGIVEDNYQNIVGLWETYGVDAVFFGHSHRFDASVINDINYYLIGVGGNIHARPEGFCQVSVTSEMMTVNMRWVNGTTQLIGEIPAL
ncbi:MAG: metallophosphoesterase [Promethearchaeota archaeon]